MRGNKSVSGDMEPALLPDNLVRIKTTIEPEKSAIKAMIDSGVKVDGCRVVENYSLQIK